MLPARIETPLKRVLEEEGRKASWLARQVGVHPGSLQRWLDGTSVPTEENQRKVADALGRTVEELFPPHEDAA